MSTFTFDGPLGLGADAVLKGTLFLALLFLASPALHRLSAGARHLVWGSGLLLLVVIPGLSRVMPWRIEVLPSITSAPVAEQVTPKFDAPSPTPTPTPTPPKHAAPSGTDRLPQAGVVTSAPLSGGSFWHTVDLGVLALWLWVGGLALALLRLVAGQFSAARLVREARPVDESAWATARARAAAHHGLLHPPTLLLSDELPLPVTTGIRHPVILLPEGADAWPEARRESVLLHEMAHVRRRDLITQLFARIVCAAWWFHPLAWRALTRFRLESERAADDLVLAAGRRASEYAQDLLAVVQDAGRSRAPMHALAMAQRSDFEGRLLAILEPGASRRGVTPMTAIPLVLI
ncbi:MAG: M56 family metallopeptidase, partial [Gemmatimonadota bacterium]